MKYFQQISDQIASAPLNNTEIRMRVNGTSMHPGIRKNDIVIIKRAPIEQINRGDIICFSRNSEFVVHRLVTIENGLFFTKGDRLAQNDIPFTKDRVLGVVIAIERQNRTISLQTPFRRIYNKAMVIKNVFLDKGMRLARFINQSIFKG